MTDLNTLVPPGTGWVLESAAAISDGGQIVGYGTLNGKRRAFLLTPPTDLAAFIGGTLSQHDSNLPRDGIEVGKTGRVDDVGRATLQRGPTDLRRTDDAHR